MAEELKGPMSDDWGREYTHEELDKLIKEAKVKHDKIFGKADE